MPHWPPLDVELLADGKGAGRLARVLKPYWVHVGIDGLEDVTVPAGFVTDFASVPRRLWGLIPPWGEYMVAAVAHDYLYATHPCSRGTADKAFLAIMGEMGVALWKRWSMYTAVRAFGWLAWRRRRR